jgi:hypothetical protein
MAAKTPLPVIKLPKGRVSALFANALPKREGRIVIDRGALGFGLPGTVRHILLPGALVSRIVAQIKALDAGAVILLEVEGLGRVKIKATILTSPHTLDHIQIDLVGGSKKR